MLAAYIDEVQGHLNDSGGQFFTTTHRGGVRLFAFHPARHTNKTGA
jgi:hypothetical protein